MATEVFAQEKSISFAIDHADAVVNAGGCTQDWWDTEVASSSPATA